MSEGQTFRCLLIGESSLLDRSAELIRSRGHEVVGTIAPGSSRSGIPRFVDLAEAMVVIKKRPDLLFSIVNRRLLTRDEIAWPRVAAINYHDSPLPRYAGVNSTSWAILNGEITHGVTWHQMTPRFDAGEILTQVRFAIEPDETALSLNAKCYEWALKTLEDVLRRFERGDHAGQAQDLSTRTVCASRMRLPAQGIVSWKASAEAICRAVRAAAQGPYENSFGLTKVRMPDGELLVIGDAKAVDCPTDARPGYIEQSGKDGLTVATSAGGIKIGSLRRLTGEAFEPLDNLQGNVLEGPSDSEFSEIELASEEAYANESDWVRQLAELAPPLGPYPLRPERYPQAATTEHVIIRDVPEVQTAEAAFARIVSQLAQKGGQTKFSIGVARSMPVGFAKIVPISIDLRGQPELPEAIACGFRLPPLSEDLSLRFPQLRASSLRHASISVVLCHGDGSGFTNPGLIVAWESGRVCFRFAADQITPAEAESLCGSLLEGTRTRPVSSDHLPWVHQQVSDRAAQWPERIAIEHQGHAISYAELDRSSDRVAARLRGHGACKETRIALLFPPAPDFVIAALAVLKSGAAYVPLESGAPAHRLREIVLDCKPLVVLCDPAYRETAETLGAHVMDLTGTGSNEADSLSTISVTEADDVAYLIYTSGSSGRPKGVMVEHGALRHFIGVDIETHQVCPEDRVLQLCSFSFDASVEEIFSALCVGATLVMRPPDLLDSGHRFLEFCDSARLTVIGIFASMLGEVIKSMEARGSFPATVRLATTGGESVSLGDVLSWRNFFERRGLTPPALVNIYGLTETCVANLHCNLSTADLGFESVPIGRPFRGNVIRIEGVDSDPASWETAGELLIAGPQLARAYWKRPWLNASRFFDDPVDGRRWFRTGDMVRRLPDGNLVFSGRCDRQVKINGVRVELEEIERVLLTHPDVGQAAVLMQVDDRTGNRLVAFVAPIVEGLPKRLQAHLERTLPSTMRPSQIRMLDDLPVNERGKIDGASLRVLMESSSSRSDDPRGADADSVAAIWRDFFPLADPSDDSQSFFDLGGDSMGALRLLARVEESTGVRLPVSSFFQQPTIIGLRRMTRLGTTELIWNWRSEGSHAPIYCLHGLDGDIQPYTALAEMLGEDFPIFGIRSSVLRAPYRTPPDFEETAREAYELISRHGRGSPKVLLGFSWGGLLGWEVARLCCVHEGRCPTLILLDSDAPTVEKTGPIDVCRYVLRHFPGWTLRRLRAMVGYERKPEMNVEWAQGAVVQAFLAMTAAYRPKQEPKVPVHLLHARSSWTPRLRGWDDSRGFADYGWSKVTGGTVRIDHFDCEHTELLGPSMSALVAEKIREIVGGVKG
jgi:amino acid adenylation domain-containing protein